MLYVYIYIYIYLYIYLSLSRTHRIIRLTSPNLNYLIILGCLIFCLSAYFYGYPSTSYDTVTGLCYVSHVIFYKHTMTQIRDKVNNIAIIMYDMFATLYSLRELYCKVV